MNALVVSWIRTAVPAAVGFAITWLAGALNIVVDGNTANGVVGFCVLVVTGVYYLLVRALEQRFLAVGVLLGVPKLPVYPMTGRHGAVPPAEGPQAEGTH